MRALSRSATFRLVISETRSPQPEATLSAARSLRLGACASSRATSSGLKAGVRQFGEWGNTDPGRHILIAVARYLAAYSPTERAVFQTADIAQRLLRGGELHQET